MRSIYIMDEVTRFSKHGEDMQAAILGCHIWETLIRQTRPLSAPSSVLAVRRPSPAPALLIKCLVKSIKCRRRQAGIGGDE